MLGAENIAFEVIDNAGLGSDLGEFDYIILRQAYAKASPDLRETLLGLCRRHLAPLGVVYVAYPTLPGWKAAETVRDAMLFAGHAAENITENAAAARTMAKLLAEGMADRSPLGPTLAPVLEYVQELTDEELSVEFLQGTSPACYLVEFASAASGSGLLHIGDAEPESEIPLAYGNNVALYNSLAGLGQSAIVRQQYLDFAIGRDFRRSLLVHEDRASHHIPTLDLTRLESLRFAGCFRVAPLGGSNEKNHQRYVNQAGRSITTDDACVKGILATLTSAWPATCDFSQLVLAMVESVREPDAVVRHSVQRGLETLFRAGMLRIARDLTPYDTNADSILYGLPSLKAELSKHPEGGVLRSWSLWHDATVTELTRMEAEFLTALWTDSGKALNSAESGSGEVDKQALFEKLRDRAMLIGSSAAWVRYFRSAISAVGFDDDRWWAMFDALMTHATRNAAPVDSDEFADLSTELRSSLKTVNSLHREGRYDEAEQLLRRLVREYPEAASAWHALARVLLRDQRRKQAIASMARAVVLKPLSAALHGEFADMLADVMPPQMAEIAAVRSIRLEPHCPDHYSRLAVLLRSSRKYGQAIRCCERALALDPDHARTNNVLGVLSSESGRPDLAEASYRKVLQLKPEANKVRSNLLFLLTHQGSLDPESLFKEHVRFGRELEDRVRSLRTIPHSNIRDADRPLRVGFVSGDLRTHASINFIEPIWRNLNRELYRIFVYHTGDIEDAATKPLRELAESWRRVHAFGPEKLRDYVAEDKIDILFDLSGHTESNRLPTFAMRAAPVQASWIGYPATTGLSEMDYYLIDRHVAPPGMLEAQFTEKLVYLPAAFTFRAHPESPEVNEAPVLQNGYVTFGSFNRYSKISDAVLDLWGRVMSRVPGSRIVLGNIPKDSISELKERFAKFGVVSERISIRPRAGMRGYLAYHHEVDIALDTFPYTGGTTSCHSLWMGVPVLTLAGNTRISRQTAGGLGLAGLSDWICTSEDEYIEKAVAWSDDVAKLGALRANMRQQLRETAFCRSDVAARGLERAMRKMWITWCNGESPASFEVTL